MDVSAKEKPQHTICGICAIGRQHKEAGTGFRPWAEQILKVVHTDLCGPIQAAGLRGERYFINFIDEMSGQVSLSLLRRNDEALSAFQAYRARAETSSEKRIKGLRTDGGGEYVNKAFKQYLEEAGILHIIAPPDSSTQNGYAERANRTIMQNTRYALQGSNLGKEFWGQAVLTAAPVHNHLPLRSHDNKSPHEYWTGKPLGVGHLRVFGSLTWVQIPNEKRQKLDPKSVQCVLVGYEENAGSRVYRLFDREKKRFLSSRDVIMDESSLPYQPYEQSDTTIGWRDASETTNLKAVPVINDDFRPLDTITPPVGQPIPCAEMQETITVRPVLPRRIIPDTRQVASSATPQAQLRVSSRSRSSQRTAPPNRETDQQAHYTLFAGGLEEEPETLTEPLNGNNQEEWGLAWQSELDSLSCNQTYVIEQLPENRNAIGCLWLFKKKGDEWHKARLVAKGYTQEAGINYQETFAPVAKFTTIRLVLELTCENTWELDGMDVKTAFLNGPLEEQINMEVLEGVAIPTNNQGYRYQRPMAYRLIKAIYGLKQSPHTWYGRSNSFFHNNFTRSDQDHSLFVNYEKQGLLLVYVDYLVIAAPTKESIDWIRITLHTEFEMTDLGPQSTFLGLEIQRNRSERTLHLAQSQYIQKVLRTHRMELCNLALTPADPHVRWEKSQLDINATPEERKQYQSVVGSLMYAMLGTQPHIAYAVSKISQNFANPDPTHWIAVKRVFGYLAGPRKIGACAMG